MEITYPLLSNRKAVTSEVMVAKILLLGLWNFGKYL